jgi:hypothetical protein
MNRAYYAAPVETFLSENPTTILGALADHYEFELEDQQKYAWKIQIDVLKHALEDRSGFVFFEFSIPRMGKRVDVVLLLKGIVFVLEFKVGEKGYPAYALEQVMDYALDLKNFHETSHQRPIVPILVSTDAKTINTPLKAFPDQVYEPLLTNAHTLTGQLNYCIQAIDTNPLDPLVWEAGRYKPTPTIIEAAQALYRGHSVHEITRSDSGAINLSATSNAIDNIIDQAKQNRQKAICFITGVPGAGKTLAGLNIANRRLQMGPDEHAVFLSGNGPLVTVLREALIRDDIAKGQKRKDAAREAQTFIQNIHYFRDEYAENKTAPTERVIIFDEAQRAWTRDKAADFMKRKRGIFNFTMSEPEFLISVMDRHTDWAVIICLIGGGQEIHTGEAGLTEWFYTLQKCFQNWRVYVSQQITDAEYLAEKKPADLLSPNQLTVDDQLHLAVSVRSFRSEKVSALVKAILDCDLDKARILYTQVAPSYPIYLTRNLTRARNWIRQQARGGERFGLLASSGAARLRPESIYVNADIEVEHWFLDDHQDVRSSFSLEGIATEFEIQGLELDWSIVAWDADLRYKERGWEFKAFKGTKWQTIGDATRQLYRKNAYRVLLTRARQGMIIYVPYGDEADITRLPSFYNSTYNYLSYIGLQIVE